MPIIYATQELEAMHTRLVRKHPNVAVVLVCNGPQAYAWGVSARYVCKALGYRPKNSVVISRESIDRVVQTMNEQNKIVAVGDLDT